MRVIPHMAIYPLFCDAEHIITYLNAKNFLKMNKNVAKRSLEMYYGTLSTDHEDFFFFFGENSEWFLSTIFVKVS